MFILFDIFLICFFFLFVVLFTYFVSFRLVTIYFERFLIVDYYYYFDLIFLFSVGYFFIITDFVRIINNTIIIIISD